MSRRTAILLVALAVFTLAAAVFLPSHLAAERKNLSSEEKRAEATHVLEGRVKSVYERTEKQLGKHVLHTLAEIEVTSIDKGEGLEPGDLVYARMFTRKYGMFARPTPGAGGHHAIPSGGERVRAYLVHGEYRALRQEDRGWAVVYPNGLEIR